MTHLAISNDHDPHVLFACAEEVPIEAFEKHVRRAYAGSYTIIEPDMNPDTGFPSVWFNIDDWINALAHFDNVPDEVPDDRKAVMQLVCNAVERNLDDLLITPDQFNFNFNKWRKKMATKKPIKKKVAKKVTKKPVAKASGDTPKRPKEGSKTGKVWDIADKTPNAPRKDVLAACAKAKINASTAMTQYGRWRKARLDSGKTVGPK